MVLFLASKPFSGDSSHKVSEQQQRVDTAFKESEASKVSSVFWYLSRIRYDTALGPTLIITTAAPRFLS